MLLPHMHLRGKDFEYRAVYPTGEKETLLKVPNYSFSWQLSYYPAKDLVMPKGTKIECTAHYDNSANNPNNPDPTQVVKFGDQSWEEMMFGFFDVAIDANANIRPAGKYLMEDFFYAGGLRALLATIGDKLALDARMFEHALAGGLCEPLNYHVNIGALEAELDFVRRLVRAFRVGIFGFI